MEHPRELSGGQQQRVALARALVFGPDLLLLDEPLGALDKNLREQMQFEIKRIQREVGITTIYVTHDQTEAMTMSDRVAVYNQGSIEQIGPPLEIYQRPATRFVGESLGVSNFFKGVTTDSPQGTIIVDGVGTLRAGHVNGLPAGAQIDVMVRAEEIRIVEPGSPSPAANAFDMAIEGTINYGDSVLLLGRIGSQELRVKLQGSAAREIIGARQCRVCWQAESVHVVPESRGPQRSAMKMGTREFRALVIDKHDGAVVPKIEEIDEGALPEGDVTVDIEYSTLNYKDGLILLGQGGLVRTYPHVPGVDFAGTVIDSAAPEFKTGDQVILTGWRVGEARWGGYAERARVPANFLVHCPKGMTTRWSMSLGTAGLTAMLAVMALEAHGLAPESGHEVLVTGAAGGVGSVAVALLSALGYDVAAATGRAAAGDYLTELGATTIVARSELEAAMKGPLDSERWYGAIDTVGGVILHNLLATLRRHSSCAAVGLAASADFPGSVIPFLLRGVNLLGIDSVMCAQPRRVAAWDRLATELPLDRLEAMTETVGLAQLPELAQAIVAGRVRGRIVVDVKR